jgi:hypothetical protein
VSAERPGASDVTGSGLPGGPGGAGTAASGPTGSGSTGPGSAPGGFDRGPSWHAPEPSSAWRAEPVDQRPPTTQVWNADLHDGPGRPLYTPRPPSASSKTVLVGGLVAAAVVIIGFFVITSRGSSITDVKPVAADIAGTCFTYTADRARVDQVVTCSDHHDGKVLAAADTAAGCPVGTDVVLSTIGDPDAKGSVLCISEHP